ncbi:hypothetical protein P4507_001547 [Enterococcus faecalis]|nr:hypothetical protein [Enterococcus faecalis]
MLEEVQKSLEKQIIQLFVASSSYSTSENRKAMTKQMLQQKKQAIKQENTAYFSQLSSSAKGKWVESAKKATENVTKKFSWL